MPEGISVIICCYDSAHRLPETLNHLAQQRVASDINWEIIVVNNNSSDNTAEVAQNEWAKYPTDCTFKIVDQPVPGLSFARKKGVETAQFDYLLFCDDDNWLSKNYVQVAYEIMETNPKVGALGGWCEAISENRMPDWFEMFQGNFAVGKTVEKTGFIKETKGYVYGAGLVIRKSVLKHLFSSGFKNILEDRKGKKLSSGGDVEMIYALKLLGYAIYFDERLFFKHFMPESRLTYDYLKKIRRSMYYSNFILGIYIDQLNHIKNDFKYLVKRYLKYLYKDFPYLFRNYYKAKKYEKLFVLNQIHTKLYYLIYPVKYYKTRKYLSALQNDH